MHPDDFTDWRRSPRTQEVFAYLAKRRDSLIGDVISAVNRQVASNEMHNTYAVFHVGILAGLNELLELSHEDFQMEEVK